MPGLNILVPFIDRLRPLVDMRETVVSFPPQPVITEDNLVVSIDTVVYFQVTDARAATYEIANYLGAVEQLTTTTLRNVVGGLNLEEALTSPRQHQRPAARRARRGDRQVGHPRLARRAQGDRPAPLDPGLDGEADARRARPSRAHPHRRGHQAVRDPHRRGRAAGRDPRRPRATRRPRCCAHRARPRRSSRSSTPSTRATPTPSCSATSTCRCCRSSRRATPTSCGSSRASSPRRSRASARRSPLPAGRRAPRRAAGDRRAPTALTAWRSSTSTRRGRACSLIAASRSTRPRTRCSRSRTRSPSGAAYIETDVHVSLDGVAVVAHDPTLERVAGRDVDVAQLTMAELRAHRPRARAGLLLARGGARRVPRHALQHRRQGRGAPSTPTVAAITPHPRATAACCSRASPIVAGARLAALVPDAVTSAGGAGVIRARLVVARTGSTRARSRAPRRRRTAGARARRPRSDSSPRASSSAVHDAGVEVHVWTVNDPADMTRLLDLGVDGLVTDRADLALPLIGRSKLRIPRQSPSRWKGNRPA